MYDTPVLFLMRYPAMRLFIPSYTCACNFWIYYEDPVPDSMRHADLPIVGEVMTFGFTRWPDTRPDLCVLKILNIIAATAFGIFFGRQFIHHKVLRDWMGLRMFSGCKGTHMIGLWSWAFWMYIW